MLIPWLFIAHISATVSAAMAKLVTWTCGHRAYRTAQASILHTTSLAVDNACCMQRLCVLELGQGHLTIVFGIIKPISPIDSAYITTLPLQ